MGARGELNSCRNCGYDRIHRTDRIYLGMDEGYMIQCPKCRTKSSIGFLVQDAVDAWNEENLATESEEMV